MPEFLLNSECEKTIQTWHKLEESKKQEFKNLLLIEREKENFSNPDLSAKVLMQLLPLCRYRKPEIALLLELVSTKWTINHCMRYLEQAFSSAAKNRERFAFLLNACGEYMKDEADMQGVPVFKFACYAAVSWVCQYSAIFLGQYGSIEQDGMREMIAGAISKIPPDLPEKVKKWKEEQIRLQYRPTEELARKKFKEEIELAASAESTDMFIVDTKSSKMTTDEVATLFSNSAFTRWSKSEGDSLKRTREKIADKVGENQLSKKTFKSMSN
jgi:hypothetical protein